MLRLGRSKRRPQRQRDISKRYILPNARYEIHQHRLFRRRAADPNANLYYNDFGIETPGTKATAALSIVEQLQNAGIKIDGVDFQSHFIVGSTPSKSTQVQNLQSFTALGVEVAITELDIRMELPTTAANLAQQGTDYQATTQACLAVGGCVGITVWDFDDGYSWIPSTFPGQGAGCLFDENLDRKHAYLGVFGGFGWWRVKLVISHESEFGFVFVLVCNGLVECHGNGKWFCGFYGWGRGADGSGLGAGFSAGFGIGVQCWVVKLVWRTRTWFRQSRDGVGYR